MACLCWGAQQSNGFPNRLEYLMLNSSRPLWRTLIIHGPVTDFFAEVGKHMYRLYMCFDISKYFCLLILVSYDPARLSIRAQTCRLFWTGLWSVLIHDSGLVYPYRDCLLTRAWEKAVNFSLFQYWRKIIFSLSTARAGLLKSFSFVPSGLNLYQTHWHRLARQRYHDRRRSRNRYVVWFSIRIRHRLWNILGTCSFSSPTWIGAVNQSIPETRLAFNSSSS